MSKYDNIRFYNEWFLHCDLNDENNNSFAGVTSIEMKSGEFVSFKAPSGIICTGGAGRFTVFLLMHIPQHRTVWIWHTEQV